DPRGQHGGEQNNAQNALHEFPSRGGDGDSLSSLVRDSWLVVPAMVLPRKSWFAFSARAAIFLSAGTAPGGTSLASSATVLLLSKNRSAIGSRTFWRSSSGTSQACTSTPFRITSS